MEARRGEIYRIPRQEMGRLKFVAALIKVGSHLFPSSKAILSWEKPIPECGAQAARSILPVVLQKEFCLTMPSVQLARRFPAAHAPGCPVYHILSAACLHSYIQSYSIFFVGRLYENSAHASSHTRPLSAGATARTLFSVTR